MSSLAFSRPRVGGAVDVEGNRGESEVEVKREGGVSRIRTGESTTGSAAGCELPRRRRASPELQCRGQASLWNLDACARVSMATASFYGGSSDRHLSTVNSNSDKCRKNAAILCVCQADQSERGILGPKFWGWSGELLNSENQQRNNLCLWP